MALRVWLTRAKCVLAAAFALAGGGCALLDTTLPLRAHDINQSTQNLRESAILLNLARASRSEPLNFTALSRYTGTGSLGANESTVKNLLERFGAPNVVATGRATTASLSANAGNSFDVGTLENREFYGGFLTRLGLDSVALLINAGVNREVVLHSILQGIRVTHRGTPYLFENNPEDDSWTPGRGLSPEPHSPECKKLDDMQLGYGFDRPIWFPPHDRDCKYQKFLYFVRLAVKAGVTVETVRIQRDRDRDRDDDDDSRSSRRGSDRGRDRDRGGEQRAHYYICFDPAISRENFPNAARPIRDDAEGSCRTAVRRGGPQIARALRYQSETIRTSSFGLPYEILPIFRSPYAVFQFYGRLLANGRLPPVMLSELGQRQGVGPGLPPVRERQLFTVTRGLTDCFARTFYAGTEYCVPNAGSTNTKEVFALLSALVAISTTQSALPVSSTFVVTP